MDLIEQKANELIEKFTNYSRVGLNDEVIKAYDTLFGNQEEGRFRKIMKLSKTYYAKQCAIICVDEIIADMKNESMEHRVQYWKQVKERLLAKQ